MYSPSLIQVNNKYNIISEACNAMGHGHCNYKSKDVINESVDCLQIQGANFTQKTIPLKTKGTISLAHTLYIKERHGMWATDFKW